MTSEKLQFTTFVINGEIFGIEVSKIQEVTGMPEIFQVPLAPKFLRGLVNLRGQIATAIGLRELLFSETQEQNKQMSVVCKIEGNLVSILVDSIGDVIEVDQAEREPVPDTMPSLHRKYIKGICKLDGRFMSIVDLDVLAKEIHPTADAG